MITLKQAHTSFTEIKKSKFISHATSVPDVEAAMAFLKDVRDDSATHNCWAYKIGEVYRFSDDGEPGGTAGKPILAAIEGSGTDQVMVVVVRFFGGIKLGAGGLVRAYGNAAAVCLGHAEKLEIIPTTPVSFDVPFDCIGCVYPLLDKHDATKNEETYGHASVHFDISIPQKVEGAFKKALTDATSGRVVIGDSEPPKGTKRGQRGPKGGMGGT